MASSVRAKAPRQASVQPPPKPVRSSDWYDSAYNNRALVPNFAEYFDRWASGSVAARRVACSTSVPYGDGPSENLDVFPTHTPNAPVMVFIHGGYWRALDKSDHSFVAPAFTQSGVNVVVVNYALCPSVSIADIALQMAASLRWVWHHIAAYGGDPQRITVVGHSAGGHLAAMLLACQWERVQPGLPRKMVKNALSISGLYELASVSLAPHLQVDLRLSPTDIPKVSPAWMPAPAQGTLYTVTGGDESSEFLRHNRLMQQSWGRRRVPVCEEIPGCNHFSVLDALTQPGSRVHQLAMSLLGV